MNKLIFIILFFVLAGCEKILHEPERTYNILDTEEKKLKLINGIYYSLVQAHNRHYFYIHSKSDDISYSGQHPNCDGLPVNPPSSYAWDNLYANLYRAIINANKLILQSDDNKESLLKGEAYFLRAYCYFKLVRIFKGPPLYTSVDVDYTLPKPTFKEVYAQIESDLLNAITLLPGLYSEARNPGYSPHRGTAQALLAEVYLTMAGYPLNETEKYALAAGLAEEVIENNQAYNLALLPDFKNLWSRKNAVNSEIVFAIYYNAENSYEHICATFISAVISNDRYGINSTFHSEFNFYNNYPKNYRKKISFRTGRYIDFSSTFYEYDPDAYRPENSSLTGGSEELYWTVFEEMDPVENVCDFSLYIKYKKWIDETKLRVEYIDDIRLRVERVEYDRENPVITSQLYIIRYAQTLLTYAEASARSGNVTEKAYEAVNKIRRRANKVNINNPSAFDLPNTLTTEQFADSVVWERAWELCLEPEGRWFDIIRLDLKDEVIANRLGLDDEHEFPYEIISDDWYFVLIPQEDRWLNPNLEE